METEKIRVDLQERLRVLEARFEIMQLIAAYGPAVDAGAPGQVADLFAEDGLYSYSLGTDQITLAGRGEVADMVRGAMHQGIITGGAGHVMGLPRIVVDGDRAVATCHSMLVRHEATTDRWYVDRLAANRWEFADSASGWQVVHRVNLLLDGRQDARDLLAEAPSLDAVGRDQAAC